MKKLREIIPLNERIFDTGRYEFWKLRKGTHNLNFRGKTHTINTGDTFGIRPATSKRDTYRVILPSLGPNYVHSISKEDAQTLSTRSKMLKLRQEM